jgi:stearoyl-CoA desaturase (Delta-9 desaturase)
LLWGGLFRHFVVLQMSFIVNTVCHLWGSRPYDTPDRSRNNFVLGLIAFGDGWHNNHHAFPYSARHGFHWWQPDLTWYAIWLMERIGLAWDVKRPRLSARREFVREHTAA